ncbi:hypothetical protein ASE67_02520 [Sphingomonas sp. Leaf23]|uniref:hypothetical protein n=1 Tax=Sphingomonas sp. Leaf23 TaxID=1735689 RepID=UPI0006FF5D1D|nr:hypothetical protein [Sphingomonas sp. Leaf23]KQM88634.1 hypothetical protein ASE67_02520 [Sphingomonas sp. Leaf23]
MKCRFDLRFWVLLAAILIGLMLFFSLLMVGIRIATQALGFTVYAQGVAIGMASCVLPYLFCHYVFGGDKPSEGDA